MLSNLDAEHQLLSGLLALRNGFLDQPSLIAGLRAWDSARSKPLAQVLVEQRTINPAARTLIEALSAYQLEQHAHDPKKCLESLDLTSTRLSLCDDPEISRILNSTDSDQKTDPEDPYATRAQFDDIATAMPTPSSGSFVPGGHSFSQPGRTASRFRVIAPHAEGGLGKVSIAIDEELGRQVALKEIQEHHADHPEYRSRFVREAEITGKLEHPGIIPVYGLGRDASGRPYYAMRFIRGQDFGEAIKQYHHSIRDGASEGSRAIQLRELLRRFLDVCNAMAYAHSRAVVHRDLKPANILLGPFGETLVVDWGLAKPLDETIDDSGSTLGPIRPTLEGAGSTPTMAGIAQGTPAYMSPEQAEGRLDLLGPASDVYSLGATLYHLLAGVPPFRGSDVLRRVTTGNFPPPSKILAEIPKPLEAICLKAMATRIRDRYESPEALAGDLKLWLADEPVSAWPEPPSAKVGRWMKRHRTTVTAAAATIFVSVVALGTIGLVLAGKNVELSLANRKADFALRQTKAAYEEEREAKDRADASARAETAAKLEAEAASRKAEVEARTAERTKDFLVGIFVDADPLAIFTGGLIGSRSRRGSLSAVEILERGSKKIVNELKDEPLVQASLMESIGNALRSKAEVAKADPLLRQSLALRQSHLSPYDPAVADSEESLGWLLQDQGKTADAREHFEKALEIRRRKLKDDDPLVARVMFHLAWVYAEDGRTNEAEPLFRKVLAIREARPTETRDLAIARLGLAGMLVDGGKPLEALPLIISALKSQMNEEGMEEGIKALSLFQLGVLWRGKMDRVAERSLKESLEISTKLLGDDHPYNAFAIFTLASLYADQGRLDEAERFYRRTVAICREKAGMGYPRVALVVSEFAIFLDRRGKTEEAVALYDEMIQGRRSRFPADHVMLAEGLVFQGGFLRIREPSRAEAILREADAIYRKHPDYHSIRRLECHEMLGEMLFNRWAFLEAEGHYRSALDLCAVLPRSAFIDQSTTKAQDLAKLGAAIMHQGRYIEAEPMLLESIRIYQSQGLPAKRTGIHEPLDALAFLLRAQGKPLAAAGLTSKRVQASEGNAGRLYKVASDLALCLPMMDEKKVYGDQAIDVLKQAIRAGFRDARRLRSDPAMESLRDRPDFRGLAEDLAFPVNPFQRSR